MTALLTTSTSANVPWVASQGTALLTGYYESTGLNPVAQSAPTRTVELCSVTGQTVRIEVFQEPSPWFWLLVERVKALLELPAGWNSHAAAPVPVKAAVRLLEIALHVLDDHTPFPIITPRSSGGVQMEWHERDIEVEVTINASGEVSIWYEDARDGVEGEFTEGGEFPRFREIVAELTQRA